MVLKSCRNSLTVVTALVMFACTLHHHRWQCSGAVTQLSDLMKCATNGTTTGREFGLGYGCYCGIGDNRPWLPVDKYDECCLTHDDCYDKLSVHRGCKSHIKYFYRYEWRCLQNDQRGVPECTDGATPENGTASIADRIGVSWECRRALCECDRLVIQCMVDNGYPPPSGRVAHTTCTTKGRAALPNSGHPERLHPETALAGNLSPQEKVKELLDML